MIAGVDDCQKKYTEREPLQCDKEETGLIIWALQQKVISESRSRFCSEVLSCTRQSASSPSTHDLIFPSGTTLVMWEIEQVWEKALEKPGRALSLPNGWRKS